MREGVGYIDVLMYYKHVEAWVGVGLVSNVCVEVGCWVGFGVRVEKDEKVRVGAEKVEVEAGYVLVVDIA